ncbi:MAG: hypothetical protein EPN57_18460 [Paraburkholderia sp.]|nr:MAG: hypothetical protein EPN57_18460 [Paraburkholderia sp.]
MDDLPDKLRRNVVVLSAAILAIAFFNLSFKPTGTLLDFAEVGNVSPFKVWLALGVTLLYTFMRYRFYADTLKDLAAMRRAIEARVRQLVEHAVAAEVRQRIAGRTVRFRLVDAGDLPALEVPELRRKNSERLMPVRTSGSSVTGNGTIPPLPWGNRITVSVFHLKENGEPEGTPTTVKCLVAASILHRGFISITAALLELYSGHFVDVVVPFWLSGLAMLVCLFKLGFYFPH